MQNDCCTIFKKIGHSSKPKTNKTKKVPKDLVEKMCAYIRDLLSGVADRSS